ncbi:MAG: ion transporter [Mariprofundales bacterium]
MDNDVATDLPHPGEPGWWVARTWRQRLNAILFDFSCSIGRLVNYLIGAFIIVAVIISMIDSVPYYHTHYATQLKYFEMTVTLLFTFEYILRIFSAGQRIKYIISFNGIVDVTAVLPLLLGGESMLVIRLLRIVRLVKLTSYLPALTALFRSLKDVMHLMLAVLSAIMLMSLFAGNLIFIVEPETFPTAFEGAWWSLVTMSTVGYGDLYPVSLGGRLIAVVVILAGITMFAMATAVVSVRVGRHLYEQLRCHNCRHSVADDHFFCPHCGVKLKLDGETVDEDPNTTPNNH